MSARILAVVVGCAFSLLSATVAAQQDFSCKRTGGATVGHFSVSGSQVLAGLHLRGPAKELGRGSSLFRLA